MPIMDNLQGDLHGILHAEMTGWEFPLEKSPNMEYFKGLLATYFLKIVCDFLHCSWCSFRPTGDECIMFQS